MKPTHQMIFEAQQILRDLTEAEGVTDDDIESRLDAFLQDSEKKVERCRYVVHQADAEYARLRDLSARFAAEARKHKNTADRVKARMSALMAERVEVHGWKDGRTIDPDIGKGYLSKLQRLEIDDEAALVESERDALDAAGCLSTVVKLDRTRLRKLIKAGDIESDGARLVEYQSITLK